MYQPLIFDENPYNLDRPPLGVVCGTKPRHCARTNLVLRMVKNPGPQLTLLHSTILQLSNGQRLYKLGVDVGVPRDTKFICDGFTGAPIIRMKGPSFTLIRSKFHLKTGDDPTEIIGDCDLKVGGAKVKLCAEFEDTLFTGVKHRLFLRGSRWQRNFEIFLNDPKTGPKLAKIFQPTWKVQGAKRRDRYHIHIAQGVDMAIILAMVFAVDTYLGSWP